MPLAVNSCVAFNRVDIDWLPIVELRASSECRTPNTKQWMHASGVLPNELLSNYYHKKKSHWSELSLSFSCLLAWNFSQTKSTPRNNLSFHFHFYRTISSLNWMHRSFIDRLFYESRMQAKQSQSPSLRHDMTWHVRNDVISTLRYETHTLSIHFDSTSTSVQKNEFLFNAEILKYIKILYRTYKI